MFEQIFKKYEPGFARTIDHIKKELITLRTGRAKPSLVENLVVEAYGSRMQVRELANVTAPEPNVLVIKPWDPNIIKDIERALAQSDLGFNPNIDKEVIRITLASLTEERRNQLVKVLHDKLEQNRIRVRNLRDEVREEIQRLERGHQISEDQKFKSLADLDEKTKEYIGKIDSLGETKEREIKGV